MASIRQRWRRLSLIGLGILLSGGALVTTLNLAPASSAQDVTSSPACRTILRGDQTQLFLYDLSQFVPVYDVEESNAAAEAPEMAATPVAASDLAVTPVVEMTTPAAAIASPAASPIGNPDFTDVSDEDQLRSVVFGVLNCTNQRDFGTLGDLVTNTYLRQTFAGGVDLPRADLLMLAEITVIPDLELVAFDNVTVTGNRATAEVLSLAGNQLRHETWTFARADATAPWKVMSVSTLTPVAVMGSATVHVTIDGSGLSTKPRDVTGGNVILLGTNSDRVDHEMLVLRLPSGSTTEILLQQAGPGLPAGVDFIGQMTVPARGEAVLPLMNLPAGNYVVVDMLLDDEGVPNLASGYRARLVILD